MPVAYRGSSPAPRPRVVTSELTRRKRRAELGQVRVAIDTRRARVGGVAPASCRTPVPPIICRGIDCLEADAQLLLLGDPIRVFSHKPEHALGAGVTPPESGDPFAAAPLDPTMTRLPGLSGRLSDAWIQ